jgi:hypothetical protein
VAERLAHFAVGSIFWSTALLLPERAALTAAAAAAAVETVAFF